MAQSARGRETLACLWSGATDAAEGLRPSLDLWDTVGGPIRKQIEVAWYELAAVGKHNAVIALGEENERRVRVVCLAQRLTANERALVGVEQRIELAEDGQERAPARGERLA